MDVIVLAGLEIGRKFLNLLEKIPEYKIKGVFVIDEKFEEKIVGFKTYSDLENKMPIIKCENINNHYDTINKLKPDLIFSIGWSQIIPKIFLDIPANGTIGFHWAKLPERRGGSPITWALIDGLEETYVNMYYYTEKIDAGDIIGFERIPIGINDTSHLIIKKCEESIIRLSIKYLPMIIDGTAPRIKQDNTKASYTKRRNNNDDEISLGNISPMELHNYIRALGDPYPGAYIRFGEYKLYLTGSYIVKEGSRGNK